MPLKTGGTVAEVSYTKGSPTIYSAKVSYPAGPGGVPPAQEVTYPDLDKEDYDALSAACGKAAVVDVTTNPAPPTGDGKITGIATRKT